MTETFADQIALATEQLRVTSERLGRPAVTTDDLGAVVRYLDALTQFGYQVCAVTLHAVENAEPSHPVRDAWNGFDLQASLAHAMCLLDAAEHFASDAQQALHAMTEGNPS